MDNLIKDKHQSFKSFASRYRKHPDFKRKVALWIFRWSKDETMNLKEFAFLTKFALNYLKLYGYI